jgi:uncharacterized protein
MKYFKNFKSCIVALSGGLDSAAVLKLAVDELGSENVAAATCINPHIFAYEIKNAQLIANALKVKWFTFVAALDKKFYENVEDRCYYCKKGIMAKIIKIAKRYNYEVVRDGTNVDDLYDFRPGMKVLKEFGIFSPLLEAGLSKEDAKGIALGIGNGEIDFATESCIATRIKIGEITTNRLKRIEEIEDFFRNLFPGIRVRDYGEKAKIEFKNSLDITEKDKNYISDIVGKYFKEVEI